MAPAAPIVVSTIGMPSLFPMRHDDLESHRADRLFSPCRLGRLKARSTAFPSLVWCEPTIVRTSSAFVGTPDMGPYPIGHEDKLSTEDVPRNFFGTWCREDAPELGTERESQDNSIRMCSGLSRVPMRLQ